MNHFEPHDQRRTTYENDIQYLLDRHRHTLTSTYAMININIDTWRLRTIEQINSHAMELVDCLDKDYQCQMGHFEQIIEDNLETARAYSLAEKADLFVELHEQCRQMKYCVAQLENIRIQIDLPHILTVENQRERQTNGKHAAKNETITKQNENNERQVLSNVDPYVDFIEFIVELTVMLFK
jgi:hypothetical protein